MVVLSHCSRFAVLGGEHKHKCCTTVGSGLPNRSVGHHAFVHSTTPHPLELVIEVYLVIQPWRRGRRRNATNETVKKSWIPFLNDNCGWVNTSLAVYPVRFELIRSKVSIIFDVLSCLNKGGKLVAECAVSHRGVVLWTWFDCMFLRGWL